MAARTASSSVFKPAFNGSSMDDEDAQWYNEVPSRDLAVLSRRQNVDANRVIGSDTMSQQIAPVSSSSTRRLARFDSNEAVKHYLESGPNKSP